MDLKSAKVLSHQNGTHVYPLINFNITLYKKTVKYMQTYCKGEIVLEYNYKLQRSIFCHYKNIPTVRRTILQRFVKVKLDILQWLVVYSTNMFIITFFENDSDDDDNDDDNE